MATAEAELKKAIKNGDLAGVLKLLAAGLPIHAELPGKVTALEFALAQEKREIAYELLKQGALPRTKKGDNLLLDVPKFRDVELLKRLVELGADVHAADKQGNTPLLMAVAAGYFDGVRFLLERGADPLGRTADGASALQLAARTRRFCEDLLPTCDEGDEAGELFRAQLADLDRIERHLESVLSPAQIEALRGDPPPPPEPSTFWDVDDLVEVRIEIAPFPFTAATTSQVICRLGREGKKWQQHFSSAGHVFFRARGVASDSSWLPLASRGLDQAGKPARSSATWLLFTGETQLPAGAATVEIRIESDWDIFPRESLPGWTIDVNE